MWFHVCEVPGGIRFTETESRRVGARGWGGAGESVFNGDGGLVWEDGEVLGMTVGVVAHWKRA